MDQKPIVSIAASAAIIAGKLTHSGKILNRPSLEASEITFVTHPALSPTYTIAIRSPTTMIII
jgi:hypothetical protein